MNPSSDLGAVYSQIGHPTSLFSRFPPLKYGAIAVLATQVTVVNMNMK